VATVLISGAGGLLGGALTPFLQRHGYRVVRLVRRPVRETDEVRWDPAAGTVDTGALEGIDAAVHLAGERIAAVRWTAAKKARIYDSRVRGTYLLSASLAGLSRRPRVLIAQSASGYYGGRGAEVLEEGSPAGSSFLARLCVDWEAAADPARRAGIRVVHARSGNVLSGSGGYLAPLLLIFRLGLGGRLGSGRQYVPWIALEDWLAAVYHLLTVENLHGPVNLVAPHTVTNAEFTRILAKVLRRPALFVAPSPLIRLVMGEFGQEILGGQRIHPAKLAASGFVFHHPTLEEALRHELRRVDPAGL